MAYKVKEVLGLFCILLPYFSIVILIFVPSLLQNKKDHIVDQKAMNDSFKLRLDTLQSYDIVIESSDPSLKSFTRRELVGMPPDTEGLLIIPHKVHLRSRFPLGSDDLVSKSSFAVSFTMSSYQPSSSMTKQQLINATGLDFVVLPSLDAYGNQALTTPPAPQLGSAGTRTLSNSTAGAAPFPGGANVSVEIGRLELPLQLQDLLVARVTITEPPSRTSPSATYTVWIEYAHLWQCLSVYVAAGERNVESRPDDAVAIKRKVSYSHESYGTARFGLASSVGQLMRVNSWSTEAEGNPYQLMNLVMDSVLLENLRLSSLYASLIIMLVAVGVVAALAGLGVVRYFKTQQRRWKEEQDKLAMVMQSLPGVPTQFDFADINKATANFHETMKLGKGGFSSVYRCRLPLPTAGGAASGSGSGSGSSTTMTTEVAIKKFTRGVQEQRYEDFLAEVSIINRLRHKNVVPLVGWSYNKGEPLLIYEYMTNGSLDQHIFRGGGNGEQLEQQQLLHEEDTSIRQWGTHYNIARDIATGLHYVHHEHEPMVLHRDIKASNIMLDSNFRARLGDFGIACTVAADRSSVTGIAGTWGYIAPDYAMSHRATRQADIYAFGVLILELVTGRKNREVPPDDGHISDWVWRLHGEGKLLEAVDDHLQDVVIEEAERLLLLGLASTNPNPSDRPSMVEAVQVMSKLAPPPNVPPERPAFVWPPKERSLDSDYCTTETVLDGISVSRVELELVQTVHDQRPPQENHSTTFFSV